jgi:hypothetical protein
VQGYDRNFGMQRSIDITPQRTTTNIFQSRESNSPSRNNLQEEL